MKNYNITVNGVSYQVTVEENNGSAPVAAAPAAPVAQAAPAAAPAPKAAPATGKAVKASVPGKITAIKVKVGDTVSKEDTVLMIEAMKMEMPVVAGVDGTVASINVTVGQNVEPADALISLN